MTGRRQSEIATTSGKQLLRVQIDAIVADLEGVEA